MTARGKRRATRGASPLVSRYQLKRALKVRNIGGSYSALSELRAHYVYPGATRLASLSACPWLSYFAPLALNRLKCNFMCKAGPEVQTIFLCTARRVILKV